MKKNCDSQSNYRNRKGNRSGWNLRGEHKIIVKEEQHGNWKGDDAGEITKRQRAIRRYSLVGIICEKCKAKPATDRHHIDDDPGNNIPSNIARLCRLCHQLVDGRMEKFIAAGKRYCQSQIKPPMPCIRCKALAKPRRRGLCNACRQYQKKHGRPRPATLFKK